MKVERMAVVGAGTMGAGIAQVAATCGSRVTLIDVSDEVLERGMFNITSFLKRSVEKGKLSAEGRDAAMERIHTSTEFAGLDDVQLAIEAVVERMDVKRDVFEKLESAARRAVLATNTSSLRVGEIAAVASHPNRVVGMHFFNPAPLMPLVEIIAADRSDDASLTLATDAARGWGKVTVRAKDTPGFIVNRVARGFYLEALRMLGEGVAEVATIDGAVRSLGTFRMGPFQLMDLVGLDVNYAVSCSVWEQSGKPPRLEPHEIQKRLVESGRLGRKTGGGFYRYDGDSPTVAVERRAMQGDVSGELADAATEFASAAALCKQQTLDKTSAAERYVFARILATIMNEAALTLQDEVATADDIDVAMQRGTNYPKGPLAWADAVGGQRVGTLLRLLNDRFPNRFLPASTFQ